ncbi:hypothetical protein GLYMA_02G015151v4 [Glycine max]|nr:hypothetical protein GLYMA_02G015151v4 [Glycine max]KAH1058266.1 hypothetical protein GYH30_002704 [Glycine max]
MAWAWESTLWVTCNIQALFVNCVVDGMPEE